MNRLTVMMGAVGIWNPDRDSDRQLRAIKEPMKMQRATSADGTGVLLTRIDLEDGTSIVTELPIVAYREALRMLAPEEGKPNEH